MPDGDSRSLRDRALARDTFDRMLREDDPLLRARLTRRYVGALQRHARRRVAEIRKRGAAS